MAAPSQGHHDAVIADYLRVVESTGETPNKIAAIKVLREQTGLPLKAAKDQVESYGTRHGYPTLVRSEPGSFAVMVVVFALLIALVVCVCVVLAR